MANVLAPLNSLESYQLLVDSGARELYTGFVDEGWTTAFGDTTELNRLTGFGAAANALSLADVCSLAERCAHDGVRLYVTFNASHYAPEGVTYIVEHFLPALAKAQVTGIIVSNTQLIAHARELGLGCVASTLCDVSNHLIAQAYADLGVTRIVLPRHLSLDEIAEIIRRVPGVEYEVFAMRNGCVFADSHCLGAHRAGRPSLCRSIRESNYWECPTGAEFNQLTQSVATNDVWASTFHLHACSLCATRRLLAAGACSFKVVGRCDDADDIAESVTLLATALHAAENAQTDGELFRSIRRPQPHEEYCGRVFGMSCYYPKSTFMDFKGGMM